MLGEIALDTTTAIRYLNGDPTVVTNVIALPTIILPLTVVGELLFGAENSARPMENLIGIWISSMRAKWFQWCERLPSLILKRAMR